MTKTYSDDQTSENFTTPRCNITCFFIKKWEGSGDSQIPYEHSESI